MSVQTENEYLGIPCVLKKTNYIHMKTIKKIL